MLGIRQWRHGAFCVSRQHRLRRRWPRRILMCLFTVSVKRRLRTADCGLRTADSGPGVKCRLSLKCRLQTESKTLAGVKCRPSINCSRRRVYGQIKSRKMHVNKHFNTWWPYICFHKSIHSSLELRGRPKNIIAVVNLFSLSEHG